MSRQFINALQEKSLNIACDIAGKFYITGYGGMGMQCISPASDDTQKVILSLIEEGKLKQSNGVQFSIELGLDLKYYDYIDV